LPWKHNCKIKKKKKPSKNKQENHHHSFFDHSHFIILNINTFIQLLIQLYFSF